MPNSVTERVQGLIYLLKHPKQVKWLIIRETRFRNRKQSKRDWVEWQKYDARLHISMMQENAEKINASVLNSARIQDFSELINTVGSNLSVLDVGCGDGVISKPIAKMGNEVVSMELPGVANLARVCGVTSVVAGDAEQLAFAPHVFDLVLASEVVEHMWNPQNFIDEAYRVLRPEGYLIVETPEGEEGLNYDSHKHFFTVERLKQMLNAKFVFCEVKRLEATGSAQTPTIILLLKKTTSTGKQPEGQMED